MTLSFRHKSKAAVINHLSTKNISFAALITYLCWVIFSYKQTQLQLSHSSSSSSKIYINSNQVVYKEYVPASTEDYVMNNFEALKYVKPSFEDGSNYGCKIYEHPDNTTEENYHNLYSFVDDLNGYNEAINNFNTSKTTNLLETIRNGDHSGADLAELCKAVRPHPQGLSALFPSQQLSFTKAGFVEPLLPPMRHPRMCTKKLFKPPLTVDHLVHDFEAMCLSLKHNSRIVLIDMGAALDFHVSKATPIFQLIEQFEKHGFPFDHIYAFEIEPKDTKTVFEKNLPEKYFASYHWINTGVDPTVGSKLNPLNSIVSKFNEDDYILVKLDIDTAAVELPLAKQLLEDDSINKLVDHFYFEHHVFLFELRAFWGRGMKGSIKDSFELMNGLRKKGVASHYWP